jgi:hypothetical protein
MNALVISIGTDGNVRCLHTDALPLHEIGRLAVRRASNIEFNEAAQKWEVFLPEFDAPAFSAATRAECIAWEVETLNQVLALTGGAEGQP